jgi:O-antigen/teichoic acid export membrane protein
MAFSAVLGAFTLSGMAISVKRAIAKGNEGALRYGFRVKMLWSITIVLASGCISAYYFFAGNNILGTAFLIVGLFTPFIESFSLYKSYLTGSQKFKESALLGFWRKPMVIAAVLVTLVLTNDPLIILFVYFLSNAISVGLLYQLVIKKYNLPYTEDLSALNYGKHLSVMGIAGTIGGNADKIIIFTVLGGPAVAAYSFATLPATHLLKFFGFLGNDLIFPKFAKQSFEVIEKNIIKKVLLFFLATVVIVTAYILSAKSIFTLLFPAYPEAIMLSQVAVLALLTKPNALFGLVF